MLTLSTLLRPNNRWRAPTPPSSPVSPVSKVLDYVR